MTSSGALDHKAQSASGSAIQAQLKRLSPSWLAAWIVLLLGASGFTVWQVRQTRVAQLREAEAQAEQVVAPPTVTALGRLEPQGELINLTAPTSVQMARVEALLVKEGDRVEAGDMIAILDNRDRLQAALQKAKEQVLIAQAQLAQVEAGAKTGELDAQQAEISRLEAAQLGDLETQRATIARLEAEVANADVEYQRYESLFQRGAVSTSERDAKQLTFATAQRSLEEARAGRSRIQTTSQQQIEQARARLDQIGEVRPVDVELARAEVRSAQASVAEAKANLAQAEIKSPTAGQVVEIHTRAGESVDTTEGIATLGQTTQMMVVAEVYQSDIGKIEVGQSVGVTTPVVSEKLQGRVERIGLQVNQQQVVDEDPAANIDARVVDVYIRLDKASSEQVTGLTNLQVTAKILVN